jgi:hypothetical protein
MRCERIRDQDTLRTQDHDSTMQRTQIPPLDEISLNRLECFDGHDGCDGRGVEFYGYMRLRQPNDTSTGHLRDEYGVQFGWSFGQHRVNTLGEARINTLGGHSVNTLGGHSVNTLGGHRVNTLRGDLVNTLGGARITTLKGIQSTSASSG